MGIRPAAHARRLPDLTGAAGHDRPAGDDPAPATDRRPTSDAGEYLTATAIIAVGVVFWVGAADYSDAARRWPVFLSFVVVGLGVTNLLALVYRRAIADRRDARSAAPPPVGEEAAGSEDPAPADPVAIRTAVRRQVGTGLFCLAYAALAYAAGFLAATAVLVPLYLLVSFGRRRPVLAASVTAGVLVFMHLVFGGVLNAPLERGVWVGVDLSWLPF